MKNKNTTSNIVNVETDTTIVKCSCVSNAISVYLKPSINCSEQITIKKTDSSANAVTIYPSTGETIDGAASVTLTIINDKKTLIPISGGWSVIDNINDLTTSAVTLTGTQTVTNKTIDSASNTLKNVVLNYTGVVSLAEIVAGKVLIAAVTGRTLKPIRYSLLVTGGFADGASFILQDTNSTPIVIVTALTTALTNGAKIAGDITVTDVTNGAGYQANLTASKGIAVKADAAMTTGTSVKVSIDYVIV